MARLHSGEMVGRVAEDAVECREDDAEMQALCELIADEEATYY